MSYGFEGWGGGFADPLVDGNGELIIPAIQSPNFDLATETGWAIMQNGDAYFFDVTATGSVTATTVIVHGTTGGVFVYSGAPGSGNLLGSFAGMAGTDPYGNDYPQGLLISNGTDSIVIGETGGSPLIYFPTGRSQITNSSAIQVITQGSGTASYEQIQFLGAEDSTQKDAIDIAILSSSSDGTQQPQIQHFYQDPNGNYHFLIVTEFEGTTINGGTLYATQPGTGTSRTNVAAPEAWHNMTLTSSFTTNAQDQAPRYRLEGIGGGICRIDGVSYTVNASTPSGTTIATLPVGYRPTIRKRGVGITNYSGYTTPGGTLFQVLPTGAIVTAAASTAAGNQLVFDGFTFPVD